MANRFTRRSDGTTGSIPQDYTINIHIVSATDAVDQIVWAAPHPVEFVGVDATFAVASSSGTLQIQKCPVGTAAGSGTALLTGTMSLSGSASVTVSGTPITTKSSLQLATTDRLALDFGGTVTNLTNCNINLRVKKIQAVGSDR